MAEELQRFPNLARRIARRGSEAENYNDVLLPEASTIVEDVTNIITDELVAAGMPRVLDHYKMPNQGVFNLYGGNPENLRLKNGCFPEVPTEVLGLYNGWKFERRWYYYAVEGNGIPPLIAEEFHRTWGTQVRVEGHCGCPSPLEYCHGFAVGSYHIDTPAGLKAFLELLNTIYIPSPKVEN